MTRRAPSEHRRPTDTERTTPGADTDPETAARARPAPRGPSLRTTLVVLALVPSVALISLLGVASGRLWNQWRHMDAGTGVAHHVTGPGLTLLAGLQDERRLTEAAAADPHASRTALRAGRARTDTAVRRFRTAATGAAADAAAPAVARRLAATAHALGRLPAVRAAADRGRPRGTSAFDAYTGMIERGLALHTALGRADDGAVTAESRPLTALLWGAEMLSREDALLARAGRAGKLTAAETRDFAGWVGAQRFSYRQQAAPYLPGADRRTYRRLTSGTAWATKTRVEDGVLDARHGRSASGTRLDPADTARWRRAADTLAAGLRALDASRAAGLADHADTVSRHLLQRLLTTSALGFAGVLVVVLITLRLTTTLRRRIAALRAEALDLQTRLPDVVERLQRGEPADAAREMPEIAHGGDELGRLGAALNTARRAAVETAVRQAEQHRGFERLLQRIARRTQLLIGLQLRKLDEMERRQEDPEVLEGLFDLDHLTARLRRYEENLVILGGGQPQRRWRRPARLLDVLRSAQGEVQDYTRIRIETDRRAWIHERAVGPVVHVLAELMENAASFSRPPAPVEVRATGAGRGLAVEIEDSGLGMEPGQYRAANALMERPPEADVLSRADDIRLGLYVVARLASGAGVRVDFRPSAYGGTRVTVLLPAALLVGRPEEPPEPVAAVPSTRSRPQRPRRGGRADGSQGADVAARTGGAPGAGGSAEPDGRRAGRSAVRGTGPSAPPSAAGEAPPAPGGAGPGTSADLPDLPKRRPGRTRAAPGAGPGSTCARPEPGRTPPPDRDPADSPAHPAAASALPRRTRRTPRAPEPDAAGAPDAAAPAVPDVDQDTVELRPSALRSGATIGAFQRYSRRVRARSRTAAPDTPAAADPAADPRDRPAAHPDPAAPSPDPAADLRNRTAAPPDPSLRTEDHKA